MPKCRDVMTAQPLCCVPDETVTHAARLMKQFDVGPVLVINDHTNQRLVGILTDRDLALQVVAEGIDPNTTSVRDVMTRAPVCCRADEDVQCAIDRMAEHQIRRVPIVDDDGRVVGVVAQADVATRIHDIRSTARLVDAVSQPTMHSDSTPL